MTLMKRIQKAKKQQNVKKSLLVIGEMQTKKSFDCED